MSATVFYDSTSEVALLSTTFLNASQVAADPATVACVVTDPSGTAVTHTFAGAAPADIAKTFVGKYTLSVPCSPAIAGIDGLWSFVWIGTGAVSDVQPGTWRVFPASIGTWYVGLEEMKDRLGVTDSTDDSSIQSSILSASSWVNEYCIIPSMKVLTADLRWVPAGDLVLGQELIGVDEEPTGQFNSAGGPGQWLQKSSHNRLYRRSKLLANPRRMAECIRLTLADGREVTCATDHKWLVRRFLTSKERIDYGLPPSSRNGGFRWVHTRDIMPGDEIASPLRVWPEETSFEAGWASGLFDGEGWLASSKPTHIRVGVAQNPGPVLDDILKYLDNIGIPHYQTGTPAHDTCVRIEIGARWAVMELMGRLRPKRLLPQAARIWEDKRIIRNGSNSVRVIAAAPAGVQEVISLSTSTGTYITEGLVSHNCGQHFYRITETRTFVPHDLWIMDIDPVVTVTAFNVDRDGDGTFEESWTQNVDYQLLLGKDRYNINALGIARPYKLVQVTQSGKWLPFLWPYSHWDRVQITGTWGWPAVPPMVAEAVRILAADEYKMKDAPFGVAGASDLGVVRIQSNPWLVENLQRFIHTEKKVGV